MRVLYKPFALIAAAVGARLGRNVFMSLWGRIDADEPPQPATEQAPLPKVLVAAALEGATMAAVGALIDRAGYRTFHHLTGIWPAKEDKKKD